MWESSFYEFQSELLRWHHQVCSYSIQSKAVLSSSRPWGVCSSKSRLTEFTNCVCTCFWETASVCYRDKVRDGECSPQGAAVDVGGGPDFDTAQTAGCLGTVRLHSQEKKGRSQLLGRDSNRQRQKVKAAQQRRRSEPGGLIQCAQGAELTWQEIVYDGIRRGTFIASQCW